ncbi:DUF2249 domain-containing protein [Mesorhizobium sp.]|uniref:DUF2249 domain-containing protein n=1 Tax=Mesorhizobium sp. TaxID=1871066 RepID=UPI000FE71DAB|nr:DUF2249 domain-containing protein [Mesorhizobium sp.]RWM28580.1 MAG: DUF2249 domain-containing protein [Mesorhizobium sp.]RWM39456.1 MAG: DUF2249 domain-containing protein [Mesorhizobium sp.]TJV52511.1 MAG: DUF2249 domain-containing protein [Mesorhizobium sp.]
MSAPHCDLDVRPILREGGDPFAAIMQAVAALAPGQSLRLLAPFKPVPLFHVLGARGFSPSAREIGSGDWEVIFTPEGVEQPEEAPLPSHDDDDWPAPDLELDSRDLEPPEPMVRALQAVETLAPGQTVAVLLPREPIFLFDELRARGHHWRGAFEPEGHYRVVIRSGGRERS